MLNKSIIAAALAAFTFITPAIAAGEGAGGDAEKGKKVFKKCKACHAVGDGAKIKVGPPLKDIFGSKAASYEGYKYKKSLKALGEKEGFVWTEDELFAFLKKPKKYLKETLGVKNVKTAMTTKVKKDEKRKDLIAYLKTFSASSASAAVAKVEEAPKVAEETKTDAPKDAEVKTEMASFGGDAEKGKKVFKKCKACHAVGDGAKIKVGPPLTNIVGSKAGAYEGYKYSKSLKALAEKENFVWTEEELFAFLKKPKKYLKKTLEVDKAKTKMSFKLKKEEARRNVIAYLKSLGKPAE